LPAADGTEAAVSGREPGPSALWLVRHGESMGNVADAQAHETGADRLDLDVRDPDVDLSDTGRDQASSLGRWLAALPEAERPTAVLSSPFTRALRTAELAAEGLELAVRTDERLRERDFGAFDGMTGAGIRDQYPDEARRRQSLGKFYYRPPSGESWADVALRLRSLLATEALRHDGERLLVVAHQAVIMVFRYVLEGLSERELLEIDDDVQIANASFTRYEPDDEGHLVLRAFNCVDHLETEDVTEEREPGPSDEDERAGEAGVHGARS
jgi:broad specificity phosphatase PhoE